MTVVEAFVKNFREVEKEKPSLMNALKAGEEKSRKEFGGQTPEKTAERTNKKIGEEL